MTGEFGIVLPKGLGIVCGATDCEGYMIVGWMTPSRKHGFALSLGRTWPFPWGVAIR